MEDFELANVRRAAKRRLIMDIRSAGFQIRAGDITSVYNDGEFVRFEIDGMDAEEWFQGELEAKFALA